MTMELPHETHIPIKIINEEMNLFISKRPHWIISSGNSIFFGVVLLIITVLYFTPQQDNLNVRAQIVPVLRSIPIIIPDHKNNITFVVKTGDSIKKGETIAIINSLIAPQAYTLLNNVVNHLPEQGNNFEHMGDLAELQMPYEAFCMRSSKATSEQARNRNSMQFKGLFENWKKTHLVLSPANGLIIQDLHQLSGTNAASALYAIYPARQRFQVRLIIPQDKIAKVNVGQNIMLSFDAFPYKIYGKLKLRLDSLTNIPIDSNFIGRSFLPDVLSFKNDKKIPVNEQLKVHGQMIVAQSSMLSKLLPHW